MMAHRSVVSKTDCISSTDRHYSSYPNTKRRCVTSAFHNGWSERQSGTGPLGGAEHSNKEFNTICLLAMIETSWISDIDSEYSHMQHSAQYRVSQEERSIFWEVIVSVILSRKLYMYMCIIPNRFRDTAISLYSSLYTAQTSNTPCPHTSCKVHWYWRWNFWKCIILGKLYQLCQLNNKYRY
jgi:hypothetical protein